MRRARVMSFTLKQKDEHSQKLSFNKLQELPFEDFQVQMALIDVLKKKSGRQFEEFQFLHHMFMRTEFYSYLVRDFGVEFAFDAIQNMEYEQVDSHQILYQDSEANSIQNIYFILYGNISKVSVEASLQKSQIVSQPDLQQFKRGEAVGLEIINQNCSGVLQGYSYVTKSRCDLAKITRSYIQKKLEKVQVKLQHWKDIKNSYLNIINIIKQNDLFELVSHFDIFEIASQSQIIFPQQGEYLYQKNQKTKYFYLILEGEVQIIQGYSQVQQPQLEANLNQNNNQNIIAPTCISHKRSVSFGGYLLNSKTSSQSPINCQQQLTEQVLSTIGKDEFFGICEFFQGGTQQLNQVVYLYSAKVSCKNTKLLQIKGKKVFNKLKIINSSSYNKIKKLVFDQKRVYEEREKVTENVKLNFMRQATEDITTFNQQQQQLIIANNNIYNESDKYQHVARYQQNKINEENALDNKTLNSNNFYQLYSQKPLQQILQRRRNSYSEKPNFSRLSMESIRNSLNCPSIISKVAANRSSSSSSNEVAFGNIILPPSTKNQSLCEGSKQSICLSTIDNNNIISHNQIKQLGYKKKLDIFNCDDDPICQSLSIQMTEQMAKNKKRYFMQAMRELEKSSRTNPYTHQQNSYNMHQNKSNDLLHRSSNVRERSILEKYLKIKKKTEFKTDIDRQEEKLMKMQNQQNSLSLKQKLYDISDKVNTNTTNNETINSRKILRILPENSYSSSSKYTRGSNITKMDYYYDHPIQPINQNDNQQIFNGKQTPTNVQDLSKYQAISEEDQILSRNSFSNSKLNQNTSELFTLSKKGKQIELKDENTYLTPSLTSQQILRTTAVRSSISSQIQDSSNQQSNLQFQLNSQLNDLEKLKNSYKMNSNDSFQNINQSKLMQLKKTQNSKRRLSEQQNIVQDTFNKMPFDLQPSQIHQLTKEFVSEQENYNEQSQLNYLKKVVTQQKNKEKKRNLNTLRSVSVKPRQSQGPSKRVLLII
ncbi:hypothetical protein ABPG74_003322 [Tetrahymena malaccensis]